MIPKNKTLIVVGISLLLAIISTGSLFFIKYKRIVPTKTLIVALKPKGNYELVIDHICDKFSEKDLDINRGYKICQINIISEGSRQTINQIKSDSVDLGIVQANTDIPVDNCGVIASLYSEYYMMFANDPGINSVVDITGFSTLKKRKVIIGCLGNGSQSLIDLNEILSYYNINRELYDIKSLNYEESTDSLVAKKIDISFFITGIQNPFVRSFSKHSEIHFVDFANVEGLKNRLGRTVVDNIFANYITNSFPPKDIKTVSTPAVLVASTKRNNSLIFDFTNALFKYKDEIGNGDFNYLKVSVPDSALHLPIHPGTQASLENKSPIYVKYGELFKLMISILTVVISLGTFFINWIKYKRELQAAEVAAASSSSNKPDSTN